MPWVEFETFLEVSSLYIVRIYELDVRVDYRVLLFRDLHPIQMVGAFAGNIHRGFYCIVELPYSKDQV